MSKMPFADLQRWSQEVARDPAAPAFLPLAQSYRRQGSFAAAIQLCLRALARNPAHLEGHAMLAQLYQESGDHERAGDEWSIVLSLDPDHYEAHRGLGLFWLERGRHEDARRHLERAAAERPDDGTVAGALALLGEVPPAGAATATAADAEMVPEAAPKVQPLGSLAPASPAPAAGQVFAPLLEEPACLGVLVLDARGLVLAGGLKGGGQGSVETLVPLLGGVLAEATRVLSPIEAGPCGGILLETQTAMLQLAPFGEELSLLILAAPGTPGGWLPRMAQWAAELGRQLLEGGS
jgi:tetratricopeptide (TPR) repeat protein